MIDFSWRPPVDQALPADPPLKFSPNSRSKANLRSAAEQFQLEFSKRYTRGLLNGKPSVLARSWCNVAACDITAALGCPIPRMISGRYLTANDQFDWLLIAGAAEGWGKVDLERAIIEVERGRPLVAAWRNPNPDRSGHIAVGQPRPDKNPPDGELYVAQAGARNFTCGTLRSGFGKDKVPSLWLHY